jgi:hypothetical protein
MRKCLLCYGETRIGLSSVGGAIKNFRPREWQLQPNL